MSTTDYLKWVTDRGPVGVGVTEYVANRVELRLGKPEPGKTQYVLLPPADARKVAIELLIAADQAEAAP